MPGLSPKERLFTSSKGHQQQLTKGLDRTELADGILCSVSPGVRLGSDGPQLRGSRWHWFQMKRQDYSILSAESKQGQQSHGEAEEEAVRARVTAAVNVPQHGLQGTQSQWQGECQPPVVCSSWMPLRQPFYGSGERGGSPFQERSVQRDTCKHTSLRWGFGLVSS